MHDACTGGTGFGGGEEGLTGRSMVWEVRRDWCAVNAHPTGVDIIARIGRVAPDPITDSEHLRLGVRRHRRAQLLGRFLGPYFSFFSVFIHSNKRRFSSS